jgi:3-deoxy-7-phosphoheptulonate synthase
MENINILNFTEMHTPGEIMSHYPSDSGLQTFIQNTRREIQNIILKKSPKKLIIVGPCSIHDETIALDYAMRLKTIADNCPNLLIVMRTYFEKPRTTVGWKGLINDPDLNNTYHINKGLLLARKILWKINKLGVPTAVEWLDTFVPQYISDLVVWGAIGARTVESQIHRQLASGMSMPIGFKNSTSGNIQVALNAIKSAQYPHCFFGITNSGSTSIVKTTGNPFCHIILRGGALGPNYQIENVRQVHAINDQIGVMIDCSHGNSQKDYRRQPIIFNKVCKNIDQIIGVMIESNIHNGKQPWDLQDELKYGVSITDSCINIETTREMLLNLNNQL